MRKDELARERRRQRAFERFSTDTPLCGVCGERDVRCLEAHHTAGRRHDPATVAVCANCHRKATDAQKDHPLPIPNGDALLESVGHFLLGLADLLSLVIERLSQFGHALIERARADVALNCEVQS